MMVLRHVETEADGSAHRDGGLWAAWITSLPSRAQRSRDRAAHRGLPSSNTPRAFARVQQRHRDIVL
jgi:hypothetical protein